MKIPYSITSRSVTFVLNNRPKTIDASNPNYAALRDHLRNGDHNLALIEELADMRRFIACATFGRVQIGEQEVRLDGKVLHHVLSDRLIDMINQGDDVEPLALFLGRLMQNPLESARNELFQWLEAGNAPITPDGKFLAYKAVRNNYKDKYTGTLDNSVGRVLEMPRDQVDPNRSNECSRGLHFCQYGYLSSFLYGDDRLMIVEIDPADVVAIPRDYQHQKGRTWRYLVVGEVPQEDVQKEFFTGNVVDRRFSEPHRVSNPANDAEEDTFVKGHEIEAPIEVAEESVLTAFASQADRSTQLNQAVNSVPPAVSTPRAKTVEEALVEERAQAETKTASVTDLQGKTTEADIVLLKAGGRTFTVDQVSKAAEKGQRPGAAELGVAKSTFQGWLKKLGLA